MARSSPFDLFGRYGGQSFKISNSTELFILFIGSFNTKVIKDVVLWKEIVRGIQSVLENSLTRRCHATKIPCLEKPKYSKNDIMIIFYFGLELKLNVMTLKPKDKKFINFL